LDVIKSYFELAMVALSKGHMKTQEKIQTKKTSPIKGLKIDK